MIVKFSFLKFSIFFMLLAIFITGTNLTLPIDPGPQFKILPWWAVRISIFDKVLLQELLFMIPIFFSFLYLCYSPKSIVLSNNGLTIVALLTMLGIICGINAFLHSPYPLHDFFRSCRLIFNASIVILLLQPSLGSSGKLLIAFGTGLLVGTIVNMYFSLTISIPSHMLGSQLLDLPKLLGQNNCGPGIALLMITVSFLRRIGFKSFLIRFFLVTLYIFVALAAILSYSKVALLIISLVIAIDFYNLIFRKSPFYLFVIPVIALCIFQLDQIINQSKIFELLVFKLSSLSFGEDIGSIDERLTYLIGTTQIVLDNPFGIGFSSFKGYFLDTDIVQEGIAKVASDHITPESESNPHATLLYYASAAGVLGMMITLYIIYMSIKVFNLTRKLKLLSADIMSTLILLYILTLISVPYLFNSLILFVPVAICLKFCEENIFLQKHRLK